jgi:hypothetical protein
MRILPKEAINPPQGLLFDPVRDVRIHRIPASMCFCRWWTVFWNISRAQRQSSGQHVPRYSTSTAPYGAAPIEHIRCRPNMSMSMGGSGQGQFFLPPTNPAEQISSAPAPGVSANTSPNRPHKINLKPAKSLPAQQGRPSVLPRPPQRQQSIVPNAS